MRYLPRHLEQLLMESSHYFKGILVLGARQVGKSTLLTHLFPKIKTIVFDPIQDIYNARQDPDLFLDSFPAPLILDEVQYVPELLPALKRKMDLNGNHGQYFLTGSQNFSVIRSIAESMAGRVAVFHLDNFTPQEMLGMGKKEAWILRYLDSPMEFYKQRQNTSLSFPSLVEFLFRGTFPGTVELPTKQIPIYFRSYLQTYIDRDIRMQEDIRQLAEFDRFLGICASLTAQEINSSHLGREIGISPHTARRWLDLLVYSYQWHELPPYHGNAIKRISGKKKGYFKDAGFACYLQKIDSPEALAINPRLGSIFETWVINYIHQQFASLAVSPNTYHWRTAAGAEIDLVIERNGKIYPVEIKCKTNLTKADLSGHRAFRQTYTNNNVMPGLIIYAGSECYWLDPQTLAVPWNFF